MSRENLNTICEKAVGALENFDTISWAPRKSVAGRKKKCEILTLIFADLQKELEQLRAESIKMEMACIALPTFDPNGPGDCGDRQVAAIKKLERENSYLRLERTHGIDLNDGLPLILDYERVEKELKELEVLRNQLEQVKKAWRGGAGFQLVQVFEELCKKN